MPSTEIYGSTIFNRIRVGDHRYMRQQYSDYDRQVCDEPSRDEAINWLTSAGYTLVVDEGWKDYDLMFIKNGIYVKVEIECKRSWTTCFIPNDYHIPKRKEHQSSDMFICFNANRTQAFVVRGDVVRNSCIISKDTICRHDPSKNTENEEFFSVDIKKGQFWRKDGKRWIRQ